MLGPLSNGDSHRRRLTILVVEDEVLVRAAAAQQLRGVGYVVIEAADASQALQALQSKMQIDLVFTDLMMPGLLDGSDLVRVLLGEYPNIKVLVTSGAMSIVSGAGTLPMLHKPYLFEELERVIEQLIGKPDIL